VDGKKLVQNPTQSTHFVLVCPVACTIRCLYVILWSNKSRKKEIVFNSRAIPPSHKKQGRKEEN
jgi:hypothetical protein